MDGPSFKARLKLLGRTQVSFAAETEIALRTVHNWAASGAPAEAARLLDLMVLVEKPFDAPGGDAGPDAFSRSVTRQLDRLLDAAGQERHRAFIKTVESWLQANAGPVDPKPEDAMD